MINTKYVKLLFYKNSTKTTLITISLRVIYNKYFKKLSIEPMATILDLSRYFYIYNITYFCVPITKKNEKTYHLFGIY